MSVEKTFRTKSNKKISVLATASGDVQIIAQDGTSIIALTLDELDLAEFKTEVESVINEAQTIKEE